MIGLVPAIHAFNLGLSKDVDASGGLYSGRPDAGPVCEA